MAALNIEPLGSELSGRNAWKLQSILVRFPQMRTSSGSMVQCLAMLRLSMMFSGERPLEAKAFRGLLYFVHQGQA
jgi:hypothetical protein